MNETKRLEELESYLIMDSLPQKEFDEITELASIICETPISLITLIDSNRQWFKSKVGLDISETPRDIAFCDYAIQSPNTLTIVEDAYRDERFNTNPLTTGYPNMRFYAGAPLVTSEGHALGALCVIDHIPRTLTDAQKRALALLSKRVMDQLELRKANLEIAKQNKQSEDKFLTFTEQSPDFIAILNTSLDFIFVNKGFDPFSQKEMIGRSSLAAIEPIFRAEFIRLCNKVLENGTRETINLKVQNQTIHGKYVTCHLAPRKDENGIISSILLTSVDNTEKVLTKARENENKAYYESLFFNNPNAVARFSIDGIIEEINDSTFKIYGYSKKEAIGRNFHSFVHSTFQQEAKEAFKNALVGKASTFDCIILQKEGKAIDVRVTVIPVIVNHIVKKVQVVTSDITEEKRIQKVIQQKAEAQSSIFESVNEGFLSLDINKKVTYLNKLANNLLSFGKVDLLNQPLFDIYPFLKTSLFYQKCLEVEETRKHAHLRETFPLNKITLDIDIYPSESGLAIHFLDVSDKVSMREDFNKLYFVASRVNNGVLILHPHITIEWANDSFLKLIDKTLDEARGKKISQLLGEENINLNTVFSIAEKLKTGIPFSEEIEYISPEGQKIWLRADITPDLDEKGKVKQFIILFSDFTQIKLAEEELKDQANHLFLQNKDLKEFAYIVSHNLRAPVAKSLGLANLLLQVDKNSETFAQCLNFLKTSAIELDSVLNDLNTILTIREKKDLYIKEQVYIAEVWQEAYLNLEEQLEQCHGQVTVDIPEDYYVFGNKASLYTIFNNLLSNAIKFRSINRNLQIRVKVFGTIERGTIISFSDNGSGFDRKKAGKKVFKLYKQFHHDSEGRGFGLFLIKTHLDTFGGRIEVNSQVEEGASFLIYLN